MSAQHTPGPRTVEVNGRTCRVHFRAEGDVSFVRVATLTRGDAGGGWRSLNKDGPLGRAAIAKATGSAA